ncbi:MAG: JAB domain-containing protein [Chloroflexi bacterium]|nr:JAB domain-containing protein [Chloroflexota bacterium]
MSRSGVVEYYPLIRELPATERPRERLKQYGASSLSNSELLAIILRTGATSESVLNLSARLLTKFRGLAGLAKAGFGQLCQEHGVGEAKSAQIKAALELGRRLVSTQPEEHPIVKSPADIVNLLQGEMAFLEQEELWLVLLNTKNQVLGTPRVYRGSINTSLIRVGELFKEAVRENCPALIVVHNHPSGDPAPSPEDVKVTEQIVKAGKLLDIEVLDHIIIGQQRHISLKERGLGFG